MAFQVRDENQIVNRTDNELILKNNSYLSEAIDRLPPGIIDKKVPGLGATRCELESPRDSIIVEPFKAVASSKAYKHNALYVGSATELHSTRTKINDIEKYHNDKSIQYKKIVVVADSLYKVVEAIGEEELYSKYFFAIDEIDTFQLDSTYRDSLEKCIDYYFNFQEDKRCLITATLLEFSNEKLDEEPKFVINYNEPEEKTIHVHYTESIQPALKKLIEHIYYLEDDNTMVVAYNKIESIRHIINILEDPLKEACSILCSSGSQEEAGEYFGTLINNRLPSPINFITSAYFSGVDIIDDYHSILVSDVNFPYCLLSVEKMKQVTGRCREDVLSENLIFSTNYNETLNESFLEEHKKYLFKRAEAEKKAIECMEMAFKKDHFMKKISNQVIENFARNSGSGDKANKLIRKDIKGEYDYSYFNIDADYEQTKLENITYTDQDKVKENLYEHNYLVDELILDYNTFNDDSYNKFKQSQAEETKRKIEMREEVLKEIEENPHKLLEFQFLDKFRKSSSRNKRETVKLFDKFSALIAEKPVEQTIKLLKDNYVKHKSKKKINNVYRTLYFEALDEKKVRFKEDIYREFKVNKRINRKLAYEKLQDIYHKNNLPQLAKSLTENNVKTHLDWYFETSKNKDKQIDGQATIIIKDYNPLKIKTHKIWKVGGFSKNPAG